MLYPFFLCTTVLFCCRLVAKAMIQMHKLRTEGCSEPPRCEIFELIRKFYTLQPAEFTDAKAQQRLANNFDIFK